MQTRVDNLVRPAIAVTASTAVDAIGANKQDAILKIAQIGVDKHVQGEILSRLNDGSVFIKIGGAAARATLPDSFQVGDKLSLTLLSLTPHPSFSIETDTGKTTFTAVFVQAEPESLATEVTENEFIPLSKLTTDTNKAELQSSVINTLIASSTPTELSSAGKLIDQILHSSVQTDLATQKTAIVQNAALLSQPAQLADALKQAISSSGLFYESHLIDWASGKFPQSQLALEPQSLLNVANSQDLTIDKNLPLSQLIHRQLDALEQQKISWQGDLISGFPMEWQIQRKEKKPSASKNSAQEDAWHSVVKFEFAGLGEVSATIHLQGKHLSMFLQTDSEASAALLKEKASTLTNALIAAGTPLESLSIKEHD